MMIYILVGSLCLISGGSAHASAPYLFVYDYIKTLAAVEQIRDEAKRELKETPTTIFADCIRNSTKFQLQFNGAIAGLRSTDLGQNMAKDVVPGLIAFYQQEIEIYDELAAECQKLMIAQAGVDYGQLAGNAPKLTARLDYVDHSIFTTTPLVFATMIDPKPDGQGHVSRLVITKEERASLVSLLVTYFGKKMDEANQNWLVSSATVLRDYLTKKDYNAADER